MGSLAAASNQAAFPWFALKVRTRSEQVAASALRNKGYEPFSPTYPNRRLYSDRVKTVESPIFPGYIFCRFDPAKVIAVLNSAAVNYIVGFGGRLSPIPDRDIEAIRRAVSAGANPVPYLTIGQRVRILRGSLAGLEGVLMRSNGISRVVISIDTLQRSIAVHVNADEVSAV